MPEGLNCSVFPSTEAEAARLLHLNDLLNRVQGGLPDLSMFHRILNLSCGPGGWVFDAAKAYPHHRIVGVDDDPLMIEIAKKHSIAAGRNSLPLPNITFHLVDHFSRMDFSNDSFDFIYALRLAPKLMRASWPTLMKECLRLLAPGGLVQFSEWELSVTSSPAFEKFLDLVARAYHLSGRNLSGGVRTIGITAALPHLVRSTGFHPVQSQAVVLDFSADGSEHADVFQNAVVALRLIQPFLLDCGLTTSEEIEQLYHQAIAEMQAPDFTGSLVLLIVQGKKPVR